MASGIPVIPPDMRKVYRRLQRWRSSPRGRFRTPLWAAAGEVAREHGISPRAKALHLEYGSAVSGRNGQEANSAFVDGESSPP